jgi:cytochrome c-type biogenesis protein CcmF
MADIGYIALLLALLVAVYSAATFAIGAWKKHPQFIESARNALLATCGLITVSVGIMLYALITHQFQIEYVAKYTSTDMPLVYIISSLWAGSDGSLLFWAWLISIFATIVVLSKRGIGRELVPYASSVMMIIQVFFLVLLVSVSDPFVTLSYVPVQGTGLNPLLENVGMVIHPPLLLAGYVGFTVPFAFAVAALLKGKLGDEWIVTTRRWTIFTWLILGMGLVIGAWWAYVELGWGGYWAWDPVENAGLMPWLMATAFLHSVKMQRRRGMLKVWSMVLIILTFGLAIFGTFLTRSGILSSVHTFGESILGPFFLTFLGIVLFGSLGLVFYRRSQLKSETEMESLVSRESTFLLNNLLLVGATLAIFIGTMFPLISEVFGGSEVSVGAPFFNQVNGPIFLAVIFLAGICTLIGWRKASTKNLIRNFLWPLAVALVLAIILFAFGVREVTALVAFPLCLFVLLTILFEWFRGTRSRHQIKSENYIQAFLNLIWSNKPRNGGYIVHLGIIILAMGIIGSSVYDVEADAVLLPGESMTINEYSLTYENLDYYTTPSREMVAAELTVSSNGKELTSLRPEKIFHYSYQQPVTEVAIRSTLVEDLYVILVSWDESGAAAFKVLVNPLVIWIWIGGTVVVLGGLIAFWPKRRAKPAAR